MCNISYLLVMRFFQKIVCKMILECCMQERTYIRFYGLLAERFCRISSTYQDALDDLFAIQVNTSSWLFRFIQFLLFFRLRCVFQCIQYVSCAYDFFELWRVQYVSIHHLETNKLRNVAKLFAHLLQTDAIDWGILEYIHLNEAETTSSSRIFIKILFQVCFFKSL